MWRGERGLLAVTASSTRTVRFGAHDLTRPLCHELQVYIYGLNPAESCSHSVGATRRARDLQKSFCRVLRRVLAVAKVSRNKNWGQRGGLGTFELGVSDARKRVKPPLYESIVTLPFHSLGFTNTTRKW